MELIAGDGGIGKLAVVADLVNQAADLIVLLDGLHQRLVGHVDAQIVMQLAQHMVAQLIPVVVVGDVGFLEGNVDKLAEEIVIVDDAHVLHGVQVLLLQMLLEAAGGGAGLGGHLGVQEVEAALQGALQKAAGIVADAGGHVVGCDIRGSTAGRSQPD